jgi:Mn-dependent DtxR family transcriptional regulator
MNITHDTMNDIQQMTIIQNQIKIHKINVYKVKFLLYNNIMKIKSQIQKRKVVNKIHLSSVILSNEFNLLNKKELKKMTKSKDELNSIIENHELIESHLVEVIDNLMNEIQSLKENSKDGRKSQVHKILIEQSPISIKSIAQQLNISTKNVSSLLTYLRSDNINICTDSNGLKFII